MSKHSLLTVILLAGATSLCAQTLSGVSNLMIKNEIIHNKKITGAQANFLGIAKVGAGTQAESDAEMVKWAAAVRYAQDNTSTLAKDLATLSTSSMVSPDITGTATPLRSLSFILLALKTESELDTYRNAHSITTPERIGQLQIYIDDIKSIVKHLSNPTVSVFASGDVAGSITTQSTPGQGQNTAGSGSLGLRYVSEKNIIIAKITVASTIDTVKGNYGTTLLNPAKGKGGSGVLEWYHKLSLPVIADPMLHLYGSFASSTWAIDTGNAGAKYRNSSIIGFGALLNWTAFTGQIAQTSVGLNLEAGLSIRYLGGDVRTMLKSGNDSLSYMNAFPTRKNYFIGPEAGIALNVGGISAALQAYYFVGKKDYSVNGLTGLQFSFGISVNASVISGLLN